MFIEYDNSLDDVLYLNLYHYQHSPAFRTKRRLFRFALPTFAMVAWFVIIYMNPAGVLVGLPLLVVAVVWIGFSPRLIQRNIRRHVVRMQTEGRVAGTLCRHKLSLTRDAITDTTESGTTKTRWKDVHKIARTKGYVFIYTTPEMAHIIPRSSFPDESRYDEFVETAGRYYERATR